MEEKELRKSLMAKSKEQLIKLYLQKNYDYEMSEQDFVGLQYLYAIERKALELICKEFSQDRYEWHKKAEHELYGVKNDVWE